MRAITQAYNELKDSAKNNALNEDQLEKHAEIDLKTMVNGDVVQQLYILNSGQREAPCRLTMSDITVNGVTAHLKTNDQLEVEERGLLSYDEKAADIRK